MCASAVRLAQSKGLHRQPARDWNLDTSETLHRNWLFWAIYVHEKQVTHRSGRPSVGSTSHSTLHTETNSDAP